MKFNVIQIIKNLGLVWDEVAPHIVRVNNDKLEVEFDNPYTADFVMDLGISSCMDIGVKVYVGKQYVGWF